MKVVTSKEVHSRKVEELGLDSSLLDLTSIEAIAAALRRSASILCPCNASTLVRSVVSPLRGLVDDDTEIKKVTEQTLEAMIAYGDFIEQSEFESDGSTGDCPLVLFLAPPSFVTRDSGTVFLLGTPPDFNDILPIEFKTRIEYVNHTRRLCSKDGEDLCAELLHYGLIELSYSRWATLPRDISPSQLVSRYNDKLDQQVSSREVPGLLLFGQSDSVLYYKGRWVSPQKEHTGKFVARRTQAYGADRWCYVEVYEGNPVRILDLPIFENRWRGCDEAWWLQLAIDTILKHPQRFCIQLSIVSDDIIVKFFSPVPLWAKRRWDVIGEAVIKKGCLFAYKFSKSEIDEEYRFMKDRLWLELFEGDTAES